MRIRPYAFLKGLLLVGCSTPSSTPHCAGNAVEAPNIVLTDKITGSRICNAIVTTTNGLRLGLAGNAEFCAYIFPPYLDGGYPQTESFDVDVVAQGYEPQVVHGVTVWVFSCDGPQPMGVCTQCKVQLTPIDGGNDAGVTDSAPD
jgi:hypothetical protein